MMQKQASQKQTQHNKIKRLRQCEASNNRELFWTMVKIILSDRLGTWCTCLDPSGTEQGNPKRQHAHARTTHRTRTARTRSTHPFAVSSDQGPARNLVLPENPKLQMSYFQGNVKHCTTSDSNYASRVIKCPWRQKGLPIFVFLSELVSCHFR